MNELKVWKFEVSKERDLSRYGTIEVVASSSTAAWILAAERSGRMGCSQTTSIKLIDSRPLTAKDVEEGL